jgi:hypothetical protein
MSSISASGESVGMANRLPTMTVALLVLFAGSVSVFAMLTVAVFVTIAGFIGIVRTSVIDAEPPGTSVPIVHVTVDVPEHDPCVGVAELNVVPNGRTSVTTVFTASTGPLFVTRSVYVTVAPVADVPPLAVLEMLTSVAPGTTGADVLDVLFAGVESVGLAMFAVFVMVPVAPLAVFTTSWNVAVAAAGRAAMLHVTVPVPPTAGMVHVNTGPPVCAEETKVVCAGTASVSTTLAASEGPLFATVIV